MPCSSSAPDKSSVHVIEIEDDSLPSSAEPSVEVLVDNDTSKEQKATNVSLIRSKNEDITEGKIHMDSTLN